MDLLCSESVLTDSEQSLYTYKKQTPIAQKTAIQYNNINCKRNSCSSSCCSASSINQSITTDHGGDLECSSTVPVDGNMSKLMYVFTSVCSTNTSKQLQRAKSGNYQPLDQQQAQQKTKITLTSATNSTEAANIHLKFVKAHLAVIDPIFKTDRCLENALKCEEKQSIVDTYFKTVQKDITPPMRKIVAEWMMELCTEEKCQEEVVLLALNYLDRFLSKKSVRKTHLQILAAACLLLASKLREPSCNALSAELLVFYTDNSINKDDLIKWELYVLSHLGWDLSTVTPLDFLELLLPRLPIRSKHFSDFNIEKIRHHAQAFISLAAKEHKFTKYSASTIAASSIAAAMSGLKWDLCTGHNIQFLLNLLTDLTSVGQDQLQQCMIQMEAIFEEHRNKMQILYVGVEKSQLLGDTYNTRYQQQQHYQYQKQKILTMSNLSQTCKMQAQAPKELHEIKF